MDAKTRKILGAAILGTGGDERFTASSTSCMPVPSDVLARAVPTDPTVSELIPTMLSEMRPAE